MIAKEYGYSLHYILWGISSTNLRMMVADSPGMRKKTSANKMDNKAYLEKLKRKYKQ